MTWYWIAWIVLGFGVPEFYAIFRGEYQNTLSDNTWAWFSIRGKGRFWRLRRFALASFLFWLSLHLLTGGNF